MDVGLAGGSAVICGICEINRMSQLGGMPQALNPHAFEKESGPLPDGGACHLFTQEGKPHPSLESRTDEKICPRRASLCGLARRLCLRRTSGLRAPGAWCAEANASAGCRVSDGPGLAPGSTARHLCDWNPGLF